MEELEKLLQADEANAKAFKETLEKAEENGAQNDVEAIVMAAAAVGVELSTEEVEKFLAASAEVNDDDLDLVTGGCGWCFADNGHDNCTFVYCCYTVTMHPDKDYEGQRTQDCWSDYACIAIQMDKGWGY